MAPEVPPNTSVTRDLRMIDRVLSNEVVEGTLGGI